MELKPANEKEVATEFFSKGKSSTCDPFPLARYKLYSTNFYYAMGNTPAEDLLRSCAGVRKPSVLSLGCGDIRSCFYTLWKHFDSSAPQQFDGADFFLNDWTSAILARNILFMLLCVQLPDNAKERKEWVSAICTVMSFIPVTKKY